MYLQGWEGLLLSQKLNSFLVDRLPFVGPVDDFGGDLKTVLISKILEFLFNLICILGGISPHIVEVLAHLFRGTGYLQHSWNN